MADPDGAEAKARTKATPRWKRAWWVVRGVDLWRVGYATAAFASVNAVVFAQLEDNTIHAGVYLAAAVVSFLLLRRSARS